MKISKTTISFSLIVVLLIVGAFVALQFVRQQFPTAVIQVGEKKLYVQVADTIGRQHRGLGGREELLPYGGMVFPYFPARRVGIVMRDMEFPIDILWIRSGRVVDIAPNVQPEPGVPEAELQAYFPRTEADLILEAAAGFAETYEIKIGDPVTVIEE